jgi:hypothetical protein
MFSAVALLTPIPDQGWEGEASLAPVVVVGLIHMH